MKTLSEFSKKHKNLLIKNKRGQKYYMSLYNSERDAKNITGKSKLLSISEKDFNKYYIHGNIYNDVMTSVNVKFIPIIIKKNKKGKHV